uniref:Uncharacterized protein n=1 Tax=Peronospora matthiolae TaxID=2874970 RepID=A0AAV1UY06_9STRA
MRCLGHYTHDRSARSSDSDGILPLTCDSKSESSGSRCNSGPMAEVFLFHIRYRLFQRMEALSEHVGLHRSIYKAVDEHVEERVLINRVFRDATRKVAEVLRIIMHITLTLLEPQECRAFSELGSRRLKRPLSRDFKISNDSNTFGS